MGRDTYFSWTSRPYPTPDTATDAQVAPYSDDNFEFDANHEPKTGVYSEWQVGQDGQTTTIKSDLTA